MNAALACSAATMATICQRWRPDRGRCVKTYGIIIVLFMDLVSQCVDGMFMGPLTDLHQVGLRISNGYKCVVIGLAVLVS